METFNPLYLCSNPQCKGVFTSNFSIVAEGFINSGSITASCPKCNSLGYVPSGTFRKNKDILLSLIRSIEYSDIKDIRLEIARYIDIGKSPNAIKKDLKKKHPKYKKIWNKAPREAKDMILFLGWMLGVLGSIASVYSLVSGMSDKDININIINPSINYYYERGAQQYDNQEQKRTQTPVQYKI